MGAIEMADRFRSGRRMGAFWLRIRVREGMALDPLPLLLGGHGLDMRRANQQTKLVELISAYRLSPTVWALTSWARLPSQ